MRKMDDTSTGSISTCQLGGHKIGVYLRRKGKGIGQVVDLAKEPS